MSASEWAIASIAACILTVVSSEPSQRSVSPRVSEDAILQYGKAIDVSRLDPALPSQTLGSWFFATVGPRVDYLAWSSIDCGLAKDAPPSTPLCLRGEAKWRQDRAVVVATIDIKVTSGVDSPLSEKPGVFAIGVRTVARVGASDAESAVMFHMWDTQRLGQLKDLLEKAQVHTSAFPEHGRKP